MNIPLLKSCDIQKRDNQKNNFAVHNLSELVKEDLYIPKTPHKHSFFQILYVSRGAGIHYVDFQEWEIEDGTIFFLSPGQVHDLRFTSKNPEGIMINFNEDFFNDFLSQKDFINSLSVFVTYEHSAIDWSLLIKFTLLAVAGIFIGIFLSGKISGEKLKTGFGWFVLVMGFYIITKELIL